jgi:hypothetical protein
MNEIGVPAAGYNMAPPSEHDVINALVAMFGEEAGREKYRTLCQQAGIAGNGSQLSLEQMSGLAEQLKRSSGIEKVVGLSLSIRLTTYRRLSSRIPAEVTQ